MLNYEKVIEVISKPSDLRKDFDIKNVMPWFRNKTKLFLTLKPELLFDIIKNLEFQILKEDVPILKQGERGDCFYILLRGQVTIYIQYSGKDESIHEINTDTDSYRQKLGTNVTSLGPGACFGEVALFSEDCIRTATIITDVQTELIVIDRALYKRSVESVLKKQFEEKQNFINNCKFFQGWSLRYKKQLAMALQRDTLPYDSLLTKQGEPFNAIYFILSGEVSVVMNPDLHHSQYPRVMTLQRSQSCSGPREHRKQAEWKLPHHRKQAYDDEDLDQLLSYRSLHGAQLNRLSTPRCKRQLSRTQSEDVCFIGVNQCIGDAEVLLGLPSYLQTSRCTQKTDFFQLEQKHFDRLVARRHPKTVDLMYDELNVKMDSRLSRRIEKKLPLMQWTISKTAEHIQTRFDQNRKRTKLSQKALQLQQQQQQEGVVRRSSSDVVHFIPPRGALIDLHGPGTVFHHIRQKRLTALKKQARMSSRRGIEPDEDASGQNGISGQDAGNQKIFDSGYLTRKRIAQEIRDGRTPMPLRGEPDVLTVHAQPQPAVDAQMSDLQERLNAWINNDPTQEPAAAATAMPRAFRPRSHVARKQDTQQHGRHSRHPVPDDADDPEDFRRYLSHISASAL